jgi:hypothetical protein
MFDRKLNGFAGIGTALHSPVYGKRDIPLRHSGESQNPECLDYAKHLESRYFRFSYKRDSGFRQNDG